MDIWFAYDFFASKVSLKGDHLERKTPTNSSAFWRLEWQRKHMVCKAGKPWPVRNRMITLHPPRLKASQPLRMCLCANLQNLSMVLDTVAYSKSLTLDHLVQVTSERFWQLEDYHQHQRLVQGHLHNKVWFQNTFRTSNQIQSSRLMINFDANVHSHTCQRFPFPSEKRSRKVNCSCQVLWTGFLQNIITYLIFQFQRNTSRTLRTDFVNLIK